MRWVPLLEVRAGPGGEEAALWAADLVRMYQRYADSQGWKLVRVSESLSEGGGYKECIVQVRHRCAWAAMTAVRCRSKFGIATGVFKETACAENRHQHPWIPKCIVNCVAFRRHATSMSVCERCGVGIVCRCGAFRQFPSRLADCACCVLAAVVLCWSPGCVCLDWAGASWMHSGPHVAR
jgi:PCRF domain